MSEDAPNALGLEFSQAASEADNSAGDAPASPGSTTAETVRNEKKPYVNPDRVRTGGTQRVCYFPSFHGLLVVHMP
jgi:hypothetical protein